MTNEVSLSHKSVDKLIVVMTNAANVHKQMLSSMREDILSMKSEFKDAVQGWAEHFSGTLQRGKSTKHELEHQIMAMHEFIKVKVEVDIVDFKLGDNIFPRTYVGAQYNDLIFEALLSITKLPNSEDQKKILNWKVPLTQNEQYIKT